jgi:UDP-N-acetylmuramoyl-tripeptide--D-alanyl-D-alanine ligase
MRAAIAALGEMTANRRVAVLGEMKELGPSAEREHEALGDALAEAGVALVVSCGGLADAAARAATRRGVRVVLAPDADRAAAYAVERVEPGDAVLVKASRSVGAERVVEALVRALGEEGR